MGETGDPVTVLQRLLTRADQELQALAGDRSMCAIGRSGASFPAAKYREGARSALAEIRREVRQATRRGETVDIARLARAVAADWKTRTQNLAAASPDWRAYLAGGAEALQELVDELADR